MDIDNLLIVVTTISLFISMILAFFLVSVKTKHKVSNSLFAAFLTLTAIDISNPLFSLVSEGPSNMGMLRNSLAFLQLPVFYLYVLSVCYSDFKLLTRHLIHVLPFLAVTLILLPRFYGVDAASKIEFIVHRQTRPELQFTHILFHLQVIVYCMAVFMLLRKAKKLYLENYAGRSVQSYNWLFQIAVVLTVLYLITLFKNIFKFSDYPNISDYIKIAILLLQLFIVCWYLFKALHHPDLFQNIDSRLKLVADIVSEEKETARFAENTKDDTEALSKLRHYMNVQKPFLDPSLTIHEVSNAIQIPVRDLSVLINHKLGQHFYDFVNIYRIECAMEILKDPAKNKLTVLEILYEIGFNSKSSFNTAFKKHTGNTPTAYRKEL